MNRLDKFKFKDLKTPFNSDRDQANCYKRLFGSDDGQRVLDSLMLDTDYHKPDLPSGQDVGIQLGFNAGKRYVINHILSAMSAEYETNKDYDDRD